MVWNDHDNNDLNVPDGDIEIKVESTPTNNALWNHFGVDQDHINSYTVLKEMGSPQNPTPK